MVEEGKEIFNQTWMYPKCLLKLPPGVRPSMLSNLLNLLPICSSLINLHLPLPSSQSLTAVLYLCTLDFIRCQRHSLIHGYDFASAYSNFISIGLNLNFTEGSSKMLINLNKLRFSPSNLNIITPHWHCCAGY